MYLDTNSVDSIIISIFEAACRELDLTPSQYETAKTAYSAIGVWLADPQSPISIYKPEIYSQGSIRLETAIKPINNDDFDVDLICHLFVEPTQQNSSAVYQMVWDRLYSHEMYRKMIQRKNRCIRVTRKDEFYLDITPGVPHSTNGTALYVPDRDLKCWKDSNPKGYAEWFDDVASVIPSVVAQLLESRTHTASIEPLPDNPRFYKSPLKRLVQVLKRHRDIYFTHNSKDPVISIIITTLAARAYEKVAGYQYKSLFELVKAVVKAMPDFVRINSQRNGVTFWIENPVIATENFAEKWNVDLKRSVAFYEWHKDLMAHLDQLDQCQQGQGIEMAIKPTRKIFGEAIANRAVEKIGEKMSRSHQSGLI